MLSKLYRQYLIETAKQLYNGFPWWEKEEHESFENASNEQLVEFIKEALKNAYIQ